MLTGATLFCSSGHAFAVVQVQARYGVRNTEPPLFPPQSSHPLSGQPALFASKSCALLIDDSKLAICLCCAMPRSQRVVLLLPTLLPPLPHLDARA
ncbi:hypothetical protein CI102_14519 [Trichoderma harzianum]|nr:hypothetical protein CI102_14519 [Trichoderma harzianum]